MLRGRRGSGVPYLAVTCYHTLDGSMFNRPDQAGFALRYPAGQAGLRKFPKAELIQRARHARHTGSAWLEVALSKPPRWAWGQPSLHEDAEHRVQ